MNYYTWNQLPYVLYISCYNFLKIKMLNVSLYMEKINTTSLIWNYEILSTNDPICTILQRVITKLCVAYQRLTSYLFKLNMYIILLEYTEGWRKNELAMMHIYSMIILPEKIWTQRNYNHLLKKKIPCEKGQGWGHRRQANEESISWNLDASE